MPGTGRYCLGQAQSGAAQNRSLLKRHEGDGMNLCPRGFQDGGRRGTNPFQGLLAQFSDEKYDRTLLIPGKPRKLAFFGTLSKGEYGE